MVTCTTYHALLTLCVYTGIFSVLVLLQIDLCHPGRRFPSQEPHNAFHNACITTCITCMSTKYVCLCNSQPTAGSGDISGAFEGSWTPATRRQIHPAPSRRASFAPGSKAKQKSSFWQHMQSFRTMMLSAVHSAFCCFAKQKSQAERPLWGKRFVGYRCKVQMANMHVNNPHLSP